MQTAQAQPIRLASSGSMPDPPFWASIDGRLAEALRTPGPHPLVLRGRTALWPRRRILRAPLLLATPRTARRDGHRSRSGLWPDPLWAPPSRAGPLPSAVPSPWPTPVPPRADAALGWGPTFLSEPIPSPGGRSTPMPERPTLGDEHGHPRRERPHPEVSD